MTGRRKAIAFFIVLGSCLVAAAITLNVGWIMTNYRRAGLLVVGIIFFALIIGGIVVYTVFLVREIRRAEQHDSFINAVTHELKTPIASIRLYLETLQRRELSDEQRRHFYQVMLADSDRLLYTVEQVLKAGIAGQRERARAKVPVELNHLLEECADLARLRHHLSPEAVRFEPARGDATVIGDPDDLRTAVSNLLDNAVKYSGEKVNVRLAVHSNGADRLRVVVRDEGMGIPRLQLKPIFKRFYRAPGRAVKQVKGTGLGLFIVNTIVKQHGGQVFAESEGEGKGATFTLELPRAVASSQ